MYLTLNQAAKAVKKSTSTISKYVKDGKLSVSEKLDDGSFKIDPAELYRVFPEQRKKQENEQPRTLNETPSNAREIELLEKMNKQQADMLEALQDQLREERNERQKITMMLLEHQTKIPEQQIEKVSSPQPDVAKQEQSRRRRWWQREEKTKA